jgi:hypothetical protein
MFKREGEFSPARRARERTVLVPGAGTARAEPSRARTTAAVLICMVDVVKTKLLMVR